MFEFAAGMIVRVTVYTRAGIEQARAAAKRLAEPRGGHVEIVERGIAVRDVGERGEGVPMPRVAPTRGPAPLP